MKAELKGNCLVLSVKLARRAKGRSMRVEHIIGELARRRLPWTSVISFILAKPATFAMHLVFPHFYVVDGRTRLDFVAEPSKRINPLWHRTRLKSMVLHASKHNPTTASKHNIATNSPHPI